MSSISKRKEDHLDLAAHGEVGFARTNLFECVELVHEALPELCWNEIDLSVEVLGRRLRAPLVIAGMTGGSPRAGEINRELASVAEERGYGFGLGSQRPMLEHPEQASTYRVRDLAPNALVLANLGAVQLRELPGPRVSELIEQVGADALCVHLNPAQELVQEGGDRDFRGLLERLERLVDELEVPVVVKETGCGLSRRTAERLYAAGVRHLDVSGAGGTCWVSLETQRGASPARRRLGSALANWGIPTAASVALLAPLGFRTLIATGGISSGLEVAKAIALGATCAGMARSVLRALDSGGRRQVVQLMDDIEQELRATMLLVGAARLQDLRAVPRLVRGELLEWIRQLGGREPGGRGCEVRPRSPAR